MPGWKDRFSIAGRTAFVTGASKGIGAEICSVFAEAGADIVAVARDEEGLNQTRSAVEAQGRKCHMVLADLASPDGPELAASQALELQPVIDILVNSAGIARIAPALELASEAWDATMAVNLRAPFLLSRALAPGMIERRWGKIINISSQTGVIALEGHAAYASSKGALNAPDKVAVCRMGTIQHPGERYLPDRYHDSHGQAGLVGQKKGSAASQCNAAWTLR